MRVEPDLVYDVGLHDGSDTSYYLDLGYRVVAIDANPAMIEDGRVRFCDAIAARRLMLVHCAIGETEEIRPFWVSDHSTWSSFDEQLAKRDGTNATSITVRCRPFTDILREFGVPHYLKVDIEGGEDSCIGGIAELATRPMYVSWEATYPRGIDQLRAMRDLGYSRFKIIRQNDFYPLLGSEAAHRRHLTQWYLRCKRKWRKMSGDMKWEMGSKSSSSGSFGPATLGRWHPWHEIARRWRDHCELWLRSDSDLGEQWYDFHAAR